MKYALGASLVKTSSHWRAFETAFEIYFALRGPEYGIDDAGEAGARGGDRRRTGRPPGEGRGQGRGRGGPARRG